jgi:serine/threonine protein phosphatase 1
MLQALRRLLSKAPEAPPPAVPAGTRYYAVGDIHGRLDLYEAMIRAIEADDAGRPEADTTVVLLGDLVDRGPDSAAVVARTREWQARRKVRVLAGNHEEMFLKSFEDVDVLRHFLKHGGRETIMSYGLSKKQFGALKVEELFDLIPQLVSQEERDYIAAFEEMIVAGDFLFVHAGIDPSLPLDAQRRKDLLWIRDRFLGYKGPLDKVVVHGHTIFDDVVDCGNRIGIDTGAFRSGVLTSLVIDGSQRRTIKAIAQDGQIQIVNGD